MPDPNGDIDKPMAECPLSHVILDVGQIISTDRLIDYKSSINDCTSFKLNLLLLL